MGRQTPERSQAQTWQHLRQLQALRPQSLLSSPVCFCQTVPAVQGTAGLDVRSRVRGSLPGLGVGSRLGPADVFYAEVRPGASEHHAPLRRSRLRGCGAALMAWRRGRRRAGGEEHEHCRRIRRARPRAPGGRGVAAGPAADLPRRRVRRARPRGGDAERGDGAAFSKPRPRAPVRLVSATREARFETPLHGRRCLRCQRSLSAALVSGHRHF